MTVDRRGKSRIRRRDIEGDAARRDARREAFLEAAVTVIRRDGAGASMETMAREAGVTKPILYRVFGDREGLLLALGERGGNTRRMIDDFFNAANVRPNIVMELSRQEAINQMVENNLGVGTAGAKTIADEIREGRLVSWMIEGAEINWDLGLARLRGGYFSRSQVPSNFSIA